MEALKIAVEKEEKGGEELELSLELSIGGRYGAGTKSEGLDPRESSGPDNCFSLGLDRERTRDIQAMRRQEARKKREERVRKSRGVLLLEVRRFQARVQDREVRERDGVVSGGRKNANGPVDCDSEHSNRNGSSERSTSPASDYQTTSNKGGSSSDTGSHSSRRAAALIDSSSSSQMEREQSTPQPSWSKYRSKETGTSSHNMPCVSAKGNGPNAKTITGFLYKYTNNEVSIMCDCHGTSFSPPEFVEHAGGVNISNPLRHITVLPSPLPLASS